MDPRLNQEETELRERAAVAAAQLRAAAVQIDAEERLPRRLLGALAAAGGLGVGVREEHGGSAGGDLGVAIVGEELGAASASAALLVAAHWSAVALLSAAGSDEVAPLASGDRLATLVLDGAVPLTEEPAVSMTASGQGDALRLHGTAGGVAGAVDADVFVVPARCGEALVLSVVERSAAGVDVAPSGRMLGLNGAGIGTVTFDDVAASWVADDIDGALAAARDRARVAHAALCVGLGRAALDGAIAHVEGSDDGLARAQSVQWMLADIATETEAARLLNWYAASRTDASERREATAMARLQAADAAVGASRRAVQVLGAAGNDSARGVERLYRDAKAMEVHHGAAEAHSAEVARRLLPDLFRGG